MGLKEAQWIVSKDGTHTCSNCGFVPDEYKSVCPSCNYSMALTVDRKMKYRCDCCQGLFKSFAWRYDWSRSGDDVAFCPLCGCEEPGVVEVWDEDVDETVNV